MLQQNDKSVFYHIKVPKIWFRGKDVFTERIFDYEKQLSEYMMVPMALNAGNMIYIMLRQLESEVNWEKQDALIASYRDLMYKMSYTEVSMYRKDRQFLHIAGQKTDVMWTVSFLSQVFPMDPLECKIVLSDEFLYDPDNKKPLDFCVQNGNYVGDNAIAVASENDALPDIWGMDMVSQASVVMQEQALPVYDHTHQPELGERFVLPDGRTADYLRMDERFYYADTVGHNLTSVMRHNITASLIKDFEDMVYTQTGLDYDVYRMRYVAFMNKVHELEKLLGGLEISAYDILPIGERGLPFASEQTIQRTNEMDQGSLKYIYDHLLQNSDLSLDEKKGLIRSAGRSVIYRVKGYDTEYQTYQATGSSEDLCYALRQDKCCHLYADFADLDTLERLVFPAQVYKYLCNDPEKSVYYMTEWERQRLRMFGRGYADFVAYQIEPGVNPEFCGLYEKALDILEKRYLKIR